MLNNLGNNGEALRILRTEAVLINTLAIANIFNLKKYIQSVQDIFKGKQVTKVHLKAIKATNVGVSNTEIIGYYGLDGIKTIFDQEEPGFYVRNEKGFLMRNYEEMELYGTTNFENFVIAPIEGGSNTGISPPISPPVPSFKLQITLMGL